MPRQSSIKQLPAEIKDEVDRLIREGRYTLDEILVHLQQLGRDDVSRSALGRYRKNAEEQMKQWQDAQQVAAVWIAKFEEDPQGDVGRLVAEMLRTVSYQVIGNMSDDPGSVTPKEIMALARGIRDLAAADKISADRELQIRKEVAQQAAKAVKQSGKKAGLSAETIAEIENNVLRIT